jgi:hypothetical protein
VRALAGKNGALDGGETTGDRAIMRALVTVAAVALAVESMGGAARGDARIDAPRWRVRAAVLSGFGGSSDGRAVAVFPTTLEVGARVWGPLSVGAGATGVLSGDYYIACGEPRRANAILGTFGVRVDFNNARSNSWLSPFIDLHGGVGGQPGGRGTGNACPSGGAFATGGARVGLDVWMGKAAITAALGFDYLPTAPPFAFSLGATFSLY